MNTTHQPSHPLAAERVSATGASSTGATPVLINGSRRAGDGIQRMQGLHQFQNGLAAKWQRVYQGRARVATARPSSPAFRTVRRWSPGVMPPLVGGILLACAVFIASRHPAAQPSAIAPDTLVKLVVVYLLCGAIYGALLYVAATDLLWLCVLVLGAVAYAVVTSGVLWGLGTAIVVAALFGALGVWYVRGNTQTVPDGRVLVTGLAGGYARTLYPGRVIFAPFERTLATLETGERRFACPTRSAEVPNELGEVYIARAAASVAYSLVPSEAHHALEMGEFWERELHALIPEALRQALGEWGAHILMGDEAPPDKLLGKTLLRELRERVRPYGIHIAWVSVHDIWLVPEEELPALNATAIEGTRDRSGAGASGSTPTPLGTLLYDSRQSQQAAAGGPAGTAGTAGTAVAAATPQPPELPDALAPEVLSDAYEAVREGRINDPATIRHIARAFLQIADDPALNTAFPYDATAAARILLDRAQTIEGRR